MRRQSWSPEEKPDPDNPSKSQVKRQMHDLQDFALKLLLIPPDRLAGIEMGDNLRDAVAELRRLTSPPARHRQAQYVGKLLREMDLTPFQRALAPARPIRR